MTIVNQLHEISKLGAGIEENPVVTLQRMVLMIAEEMDKLKAELLTINTDEGGGRYE